MKSAKNIKTNLKVKAVEKLRNERERRKEDL